MRKLTKVINVGGLPIGGGNPVSIQSMTNTDTRDINATVRQISELAEAGCELVRVAVPDVEAAHAVAEIKKKIGVPLAADVHFDHRLAVLAVRNGADKLRINPGNIGGTDGLKKIVAECAPRGVPIRVGSNSGSIGKKIYESYGGVNADSIVAGAVDQIRLLESLNFYDIIISVKSSDVPTMYEAYTKLSRLTDHPLHLGVTEAGGVYSGALKSAVGIGALLLNGIGDTVRVSLTGDPVAEIRAAREILRAAGVKKTGAEIVSCPTCGRTHADLLKLASIIEERTRGVKKYIKIAVMGCEVNGPGEAREADVGIACGKGCALIFARGEIIKKITEREAGPEGSYEELLADEFMRAAKEFL